MSFLTDKHKEQLDDFAKFVVKELGIKNPPTISIQNGRGTLKTTANYDYTKENKIIKVNAHKRALVDVMRSLAHELTHHKQFEQGRLKVQPPDIGGEIEDELKKYFDNLYSIDIDKKRNPSQIIDLCDKDFKKKIKFKPNLVCIFEVLEHTKDPKLAINNIYKILKKNEFYLGINP